eukprot:Tamp_19454.p1 GENE.Tamp_19454~~Tamp_19454.p1  ORF type:complete len:287 (+),score=61.09 Tamp_19454:122-982(+)
MMLDFFADGELTVALDTDEGEEEDRDVILFGVAFQVRQARGSMPISQDRMVVGNTLWNSSVVLSRYLEAGAEGHAHEFAAEALRGKRVLELGAGCAGLSGLCLACMGCAQVVLTDQAEVLPLLRENVSRFVSAAQAMPEGSLPHGCAALTGAISVEEFDWLDTSQIRAHAAQSGYDVVLGADLSYATSLHAPLLDAVCAVAAPHANILMVEDMRSHPAHLAFRSRFGSTGFFSVRVLGAPNTLANCKVLQLYWQSQAEALSLRRKIAAGEDLQQHSKTLALARCGE